MNNTEAPLDRAERIADQHAPGDRTAWVEILRACETHTDSSDAAILSEVREMCPWVVA